MIRRPLATAALALTAATSLGGGCGAQSQADVTERGSEELVRYARDPLVAPVSIGLEQAEPASETPAGDRDNDEDDRHIRFDADHYRPSRIEYWFNVPEGSDRHQLLSAAQDELVERGWELVIDRPDMRLLKADPGVDHLETVLVMPAEDSDRLLQEVKILP